MDYGETDTLEDGNLFLMTEEAVIEIPPLAVPIVLTIGNEKVDHVKPKLVEEFFRLINVHHLLSSLFCLASPPQISVNVLCTLGGAVDSSSSSDLSVGN